MCDADRNIVYISPCFTGRTHDSTALKSCAIYPQLISPLPCFLKEHCYVLADLGYACAGKVIRPYQQKYVTSEDRKRFNEWHKSCRMIVENAIRDVKFRCYSFHYGCRARDFKELSDQVQAGFVLHMFAKRHENEFLGRNNDAIPFTVDPSLHNLSGPDLRKAITEYLSKQK